MLGVLRWVSVDDDTDGAVLVGESVNAVEGGNDLRKEKRRGQSVSSGNAGLYRARTK